MYMYVRASESEAKFGHLSTLPTGWIGVRENSHSRNSKVGERLHQQWVSMVYLRCSESRYAYVRTYVYIDSTTVR